MVSDLLAALSLTPEQAQWIGATALVVVVVLDIVASGDDLPENTPREWLLRLTQWRSRSFWRRENRRQAWAAGQWRQLLVPFNWLPMSGAIVAYAIACLLGHFFHPWPRPPLSVDGFLGLGVAAAMGVVISVVTFFRPFGIRGERWTPTIALVGLAVGVFLWPSE